MELLLALVGILASLLGFTITIYGVLYNGPATRRLIEQSNRNTEALIEAIRQDVWVIHEDAQHRHQELMTYLRKRDEEFQAYLKDMDRRHVELLEVIGRRL